VRGLLDRARAGEYVDCHVWTFTPQALLEQVKELRALGLCQWYVEKLQQPPGSVEFWAVLRRVSRDWDGGPLPEQDLDSDLPDWLASEYEARARVRRLRAKVRRLQARNRRLQQRVATLEGSPVVRIQRKVGQAAARIRRRFP
jgi:hypothetical protein